MRSTQAPQRGLSAVVIVVAIAVLAIAAYLISGMVARSRQHEADKAQKAAHAERALSVRIVKVADTMTVNQPSPCELEVKNVSPSAIAAAPTGPDAVRYNVGCYFVTDPKQDGTFTSSVNLPKDLQPGETVSMKLDCMPKTALSQGFVVVRAFGARPVDGKAQGDWASEAVSQKVTVK